MLPYICQKHYFNQFQFSMIKLLTSFQLFNPAKVLFRSAPFFSKNTEKQKQQGFVNKFTQFELISNEKDKIMTSGRAWRVTQLRLKSNDDLHKLWYVCVREKNILLADQTVEKRTSPEPNNKLKYRIQKVKLTMRRILGVISERQIIKKKYRQQLEEEYIMKKKQELQQNLAQKPEPLPEITWEMLRAKYQDLKKGVDNVKYLEKVWDNKQFYAEKKERMLQRLQKKPQNFKSFWEYEMSIGERPLQQEVLRTHITNWRSLNLKQRKIILGFLNAKRAKDAKSSFIKELKMLGQKIAYDQTQRRIKEE